MSETFYVDLDDLGRVPSLIGAARSKLGGVTVAAAASPAAAAAPAGGGIERFAASLTAFVAAGVAAIDRDAANVQAAVTSYRACEIDRTRSAQSITGQLRNGSERP